MGAIASIGSSVCGLVGKCIEAGHKDGSGEQKTEGGGEGGGGAQNPQDSVSTSQDAKNPATGLPDNTNALLSALERWSV